MCGVSFYKREQLDCANNEINRPVYGRQFIVNYTEFNAENKP